MANVCLPQEIELWYIIPKIRKELAKKLKEKGLKQKEISKVLGITEAAVSQYIKQKRANSNENMFDNETKAMIEKAADKITENMNFEKVQNYTKSEVRSQEHEIKTMKEIQDICNHLKKTKYICQVHRQKNKKLQNCKACY